MIGVCDGFLVDSSAFTSSLVRLMGGDWRKRDGGRGNERNV